jgi:hypothetical protein
MIMIKIRVIPEIPKIPIIILALDQREPSTGVERR